MKELVNILLFLVNILSFISVLIFSVFGVVEYILGPKGAEELLHRLNIPWSYTRVLITAFVCLGIMIASYVLRKIFF